MPENKIPEQQPRLAGEELAYATLDYIREHPEEWNQASYFCGTTACFAGRAMLLAFGSEPAFRMFQGRRTGRRSDTARRAAHILGWSEDEAFHVFQFFTRDYDELELRVKQVLNGELPKGTSSWRWG